MEQIKKKQHYVWKEYLTSWSKNEQIFTLLKSSKKIINTNIEGVVQQRFFYALEEFSEEEEIILKELVERWSNETVLPINMEFYHKFTSYSKIKRALKNKDLSGIDTTKLEQQLNLIKANSMENSHTNFEKFGKKLIEIKDFEELYFLEDPIQLLSTMIYVSFQYLRTKNMSETIKPIIPKFPYLSDKFLNFFPFIYAIPMANSLTYIKDIKFIYIDNKTDIDFITSDQPIINEKKHIVDEIGNVAQLDFYYPINPKTAIIIHYQEQKEKYKYVLAEIDQIKNYNDAMFKASREFVFSNNKNQLDVYINSL